MDKNDCNIICQTHAHIEVDAKYQEDTDEGEHNNIHQTNVKAYTRHREGMNKDEHKNIQPPNACGRCV